MDGRGWFSGCEMFLDDWVSGRCLSVASSRVVIMVLVLLEVDPILGNGIGFKKKLYLHQYKFQILTNLDIYEIT